MDLAILIIFSRDQASLLIVIFACDRKAFTAGDEDSFPPLKDDENPSLAKLDLHKSLRDSSPGSMIVIIDFSELFSAARAKQFYRLFQCSFLKNIKFYSAMKL